MQAASDVVGNVVEVQHRGGAEDVHFRFLLLFPTGLASAFSFPFTWLSKTGIYMGRKLAFITLTLYNFLHFLPNLRKKIPKS